MSKSSRIQDRVKSTVEHNKAKLGIDLLSYAQNASESRSRVSSRRRKPQDDPQPIPNAVKAMSLHYWCEENGCD